MVSHTALLHILLTALPLSCFVILAWQKTITLVISPPILFLTCATEPGGREAYNFTAWFHCRCTSRNGKSRTLILPTIIITGMPSPFILLLSYATILYLPIQTPVLTLRWWPCVFFISTFLRKMEAIRRECQHSPPTKSNYLLPSALPFSCTLLL